MKLLLVLSAVLALPQLVLAQNLSEPMLNKLSLTAQQRAINNGAGNSAGDIAAQLTESFGTSQNTEALLAKAKQLAEANPAQAAAIAAAASVFAPGAAARRGPQVAVFRRAGARNSLDHARRSGAALCADPARSRHALRMAGVRASSRPAERSGAGVGAMGLRAFRRSRPVKCGRPAATDAARNR